MDYETGKANLEELIIWENENKANPLRNEATTRFHLIDRLLENCLGWAKENFSLEVSYDGEYSDYQLGKPATRIIIEAKREGIYFTLPSGFEKNVCKIRTLYEISEEIEKAIKQAMGYCQKRGVHIGCVSNGHQIIAFLGARQDSVPPEDGTALVFSSLESMKEHFLLFWNSLSQKGILENNLVALLANKSENPPPESLAARIPNFPGFKNRNPVAAELQILGGLFLEDIARSPEFAEEFVSRTYCESGALSQYALVSREILNSRYTNFFEKETGVSLKPAKTKKGVEPELREDLLAAAISQRPIILVGDVGVGKSMFIKHLILVDAKDILDNSIVLYIDFGSKPSLAKDLSSYVITEFNRQLREKYQIDIEEKNFIRGVYNLDLQRFRKGIYCDLLETDISKFQSKEIEYLEKLITNEEGHLKSSLNHIVFGHKKRIIIFLDNVDQREYQFQEQVFLLAQTFAQDWPVITFVALRPDTFAHSKNSGTLAAYQPRVFTIDPPRVDKVIQKRLDYAIEKLRLTGSLPSFPKGISISSEKLETYIGMLSDAFNDSEDVIEFVDNLSNGNLRRALDFIVSFVGSGHVDSEKIFSIIDNQGKYNLPLHEFLRAVLFQDNEYYDPKTSPIYNLYRISSNDQNEHFLSSIMLTFVDRKGKVSGSEGFVMTEEVFYFLQGLGFNEHQIQSALNGLLDKDLITTPQVYTSLFESRIRIQPSGAYTIKRMSNSFTYTDAIITDTPIVNFDFRAKINNAYSIEERLTRTSYFLDYLDNSWDTKLSGIYEWPETSCLIRNDITQICKRLKSKNNHFKL